MTLCHNCDASHSSTLLTLNKLCLVEDMSPNGIRTPDDGHEWGDLFSGGEEDARIDGRMLSILLPPAHQKKMNTKHQLWLDFPCWSKHELLHYLFPQLTSIAIDSLVLYIVGHLSTLTIMSACYTRHLRLKLLYQLVPQFD